MVPENTAKYQEHKANWFLSKQCNRSNYILYNFQSTPDWELSEHGAHALPRVDLELNLEAVYVLLVTLAVHHVTEL